MALTAKFATLVGVMMLALAVCAERCTDVHVAFARGPEQTSDLGRDGQEFVQRLAIALSTKSVSSYGVKYGADQGQSILGGAAADLTQHVVAYASSCPNAALVLGGYGQGTRVLNHALGGTPTSEPSSQVIPSTLVSQIKAIVVLGCNGKETLCAMATTGDVHLLDNPFGILTGNPFGIFGSPADAANRTAIKLFNGN